MSNQPKIAMIALCLLTIGPGSSPPEEASLVLSGGAVWTGIPDAPLAQAVAVRDSRIMAVGTDADIAPLIGPSTRVIRLHGRFVAPGFMDAHTHFIDGGFQLESVDLRDADSPEEFARRLRDFAHALPADRWITGGDWDHERWPGQPLPTHGWIDSVSERNPVFVSRLDGHMGLANALAMRLAGVTRDTPDPPGGTIVRDEAGEPTGVFKDDAMGLITRSIPEPGEAEYDEALMRAQDHALSLGVTHITNMGTWAHLSAFQRAEQRDALKVRVYALVQIPGWTRMRDYVAEHGRGDDRLRWGGMKAFVDGSLGSHTAWFHEPYSDAPADHGLQVTDTADLRRWILAADAAGLQVAVHAIGDAANDWILDVFADAEAQNPARDRRFRVEHAQHLTAEAIDRFARLDVLPSVQPYHAIDDGRWAEKRIGADRIRRTYPFRSLLDSGARLVLGSDWTVAPLDPLSGIYAALTRRTLDGANPGGWIPEQRIGLDEALRGYTVDGAYAAFRERDLGSLQTGKLADLVVLSRDLSTLAPDRIGDVKVDYTIIGGEVVYSRSAQETTRPTRK